MKKNTLGLPLEYSTLHAFYDVLSADDTDAKNRVLEAILKQHNVKTILDLTCGTGAQALWFAKRGYTVTGVDLSPDLLNIAKDKARREKTNIELVKGDMRTTWMGSFDAVITIFNAVGHLTKADFGKAMRNIHRNLRHGGLYIFDIFNLNAMSDKAVTDLAMDVQKTIDDTTIHHIQHSTLDRNTGLLTSYDRFTIQEGSNTPRELRGQFTLQIYTAQELQELLTHNGFETIGQYGIDGSKFLEHETLNILTIAKKQ